MRAARVRTESMAQRLAKKPIAEGFELWDKGFTLGAMRLFIFKAESSPPFQLGPCLDAVAYLLQSMEELEDAAENFTFAAEKYDLIQQPLLSQLMKAKLTECKQGTEPAIKEVNALIAANDEPRKQPSDMDPKTKNALARCYYTRAEMRLLLDPPQAKEAVEDAERAVQISWDRVHLAHFTIGKAQELLGNTDAAVKAYEMAVQQNNNYLAPYLNLFPLLRANNSNDKALDAITRAIAVHPRSALIRDKAFLMSELGKDTDAISMLDEAIANPQVEESEGISFKGSTEATLYKAKAAILADLGKLQDALVAAEGALKSLPNDEEASSIAADIKQALAAQ